MYQGRGIVAASPSVYPFFPHSYLACFSSIPMLSLLCTFSFCPSSKKIIFPHSHYYTGAWAYLYGGEKKGLQILLSYSQTGPGRKVTQGQEEISRNHVPTIFLGCVQTRLVHVLFQLGFSPVLTP